MLTNVMRNVQMVALIAVAGVASAPTAMAQSYDGDGCWKVPEECTQVRQRDDQNSDTVIITTVNNLCGWRIAMRLCNETENDHGTDWICHNYTLSDGESRSQTTFFATGNYKLRYVGSRSSASDATCRARAGLGGG